MGRPPKNSDEPSAKTRMEDAFWRSLEEMPYGKVTVRDITERAHVNRNTFYYHYEDIAALAEQAVRNMLPLELAHIMIQRESSMPDIIQNFLNVQHKEERFAKIRLLAGSNGSTRLVELAKSLIVGEWLALYGLEEGDLSEEAQAIVDFTFGGVSAIWSQPRYSNVNALLGALLNTEIIAYNITLLRKALAQCAEAKEAGRQSL